jgi:hypothetical protein
MLGQPLTPWAHKSLLHALSKRGRWSAALTHLRHQLPPHLLHNTHFTAIARYAASAGACAPPSVCLWIGAVSCVLLRTCCLPFQLHSCCVCSQHHIAVQCSTGRFYLFSQALGSSPAGILELNHVLCVSRSWSRLVMELVGHGVGWSRSWLVTDARVGSHWSGWISP